MSKSKVQQQRHKTYATDENRDLQFCAQIHWQQIRPNDFAKKINRATKHTENYARTRNNNYTTYVKGKYNNNNTKLALHMKIETCNFAQKNIDKKLLSAI